MPPNNLLPGLDRKETDVKFLALLLALLAVVGCTTVPSDVPADPSYASDVQTTIFNNHCIQCHGTSSPPAGYSLTSYAGATGKGSDTVPNVITGNADSSKLYRRITGTESPQMPLGLSPLDTVKTATIRNWTNKGAKDN
jgi:mono/diheme cytochrome c family protein